MQFFKKIFSPLEKIKKFFLRPVDAGKFAVSFIAAFAGFFIFWGLLVFLIDPYFYYHRAWGLQNVYNNSRAMVPGVARNFEFDTVVFGTSMCQNFKCSEINETLDVTCVKATSAGLSSAAFARYFDTIKMYRKDKFKRCIMGVDIWSFAKDDPGKRTSYHYLYEDRLFPVEYFYSADTAEAIWDMLKTNAAAGHDPIARHEMNEDLMFSNKPKYIYSRAALEEDVRTLKISPAAPDEQTLKNLEDHLFSRIRNNPDIRFDLFLPPYSIYFWCLLHEDGKLESYLAMRDEFIRQASRYPNVRIHDFQSDFAIICNLDNYKDVTHYSPAVNTIIIKSIKEGRHLVTPEKLPAHTGAIRAKSAAWQKNFDLLRKSGKRN